MPGTVFPVSVSETADFLGARFEEGCGSSTLASIASAIAFGHRMRGLPDPTVGFRIRTLLAGSRRLHPSRDQRLALTVADLQRLCTALSNLSLDPIARAAYRTAFSLAFFAMLRPSEVAIGANSCHTIRFSGVRLNLDRLDITVPSSKTSVGPAHIQLLARPDIPVCPVAAMRDYLSIRSSNTFHDALFIDGQQRSLTARALTRTLKDAGRIVGLDPSRLFGHCLRIGGASHGAAIGLSELQLAQAGRWSSLMAMRRYIRRPVSLLHVTPSIRRI